MIVHIIIYLIIVISSEKLLMFTIPSWSLKDIMDFVEIISIGLNGMIKTGFDIIIINHIGNQRGYVILSNFVLNVIFPEENTPHFIASFPVTDANILNYISLFDNYIPSSFPENEELKKEDIKPCRNVTLKGEINGEKRERNREW